MNEQELNDQIKDAENLVAKAEKLVADNKSFYERAGISGDISNIVDDILVSDSFDTEFKDKVKEEHDKAMSKIEAQSKQNSQAGSSTIASRSGVTKI